ncbi:MAG: VWA domain-containing protein, partial [Rhodospirillaceae bacterium]
VRLAVTIAALCPAHGQVPQVIERVEVSRVVVDLHVLADDGRPIRGLTRADLRVSVDGKPVKIDALRWTTGSVALGGTAPPLPASGLDVEASEAPRGPLVMLFVQKDLEPSRIEGLMPMLRQMETLVGGFEPDVRVAVASFEHHLELWSDFTTDRAAVRAILTRSILFAGRAGELVSGAPPLLARSFDRDAGRRAYSMERALAVLGEALDPIPGPKSVVLVGHGFGRIIGGEAGSSRVGYEPEYKDARRLLSRARATVYCLDVTRADSHTLETGLMRVAEDTGGFFLRTNWFPGQAVARIAEALGGHYELSFEKPDLPRGEHAIRVELVGRRGVVFARRTYVG